MTSQQSAGALMAAGWMLLFMIVVQVSPRVFIMIFSKDPAVLAVGEEYLRIISWNFVASGVIFVGSSMFQAMGNTVPSLVTSGARILIVAIPVVVLSRLPGFQLRWIWLISMSAVWVQLALSLLLLRREYERRLNFGPTRDVISVAAEPSVQGA